MAANASSHSPCWISLARPRSLAHGLFDILLQPSFRVCAQPHSLLARQVHTSGANFLIRQSGGERGVGGVDGEPVETLCVGFSGCHNTAKEAFKSSVALIQSSIKSHVQQGALASNFSEPQARDRQQLPSHMSTATVVRKRPYFPQRLPTTTHAAFRGRAGRHRSSRWPATRLVAVSRSPKGSRSVVGNGLCGPLVEVNQ